MSTDPSPRPQYFPIPPDLSVDALTYYVYRHFSHLLTEEELAAASFRTQQVKQLCYCDPWEARSLEFFRIKHPDLMRRIEEHGLGTVMRAAADRVLRDNPHEKILHNCAKCGELCLTPRAQCCLACGFDWHLKQGE